MGPATCTIVIVFNVHQQTDEADQIGAEQGWIWKPKKKMSKQFDFHLESFWCGSMHCLFSEFTICVESLFTRGFKIINNYHAFPLQND